MSCHAIDVVEVRVIGDYQLAITFENGKKGQINIAKHIAFKGIFAPLKDKKYFAQVFVNADTGTICWENGADVSPVFLYNNMENI